MRHKHRKGKSRGQKTIPLRALLRCEWEQYDRCAMLIGGGITLILALCCRFAVGSPVYARHLLSMSAYLPSGLCLVVIGGGASFLHGALIGAMAVTPSPAILRARFHGTVLLIPMTLFYLCWYPLLFGALAPALALISIALAMLCAVCALSALLPVSRIASIVLLIQLLWYAWLGLTTAIVVLFN